MNKSSEEIRNGFNHLSTTGDLASLLEVSEDILRWHSVRSPRADRYREFRVAKKAGGERIILAPSPGLKMLQKKVCTVFQAIYRPRNATFGFVRGRSIKGNAMPHVGKRWVLNLDLEEFFPSINFGRVRGLLLKEPYGLAEPLATMIAQICCHNNELPQGAPTSPVISNMICRRMDNELIRLAIKYGCNYSRYADDITFSTNWSMFPKAIAIAGLGEHGGPVELGQDLTNVIHSNGFQVNNRKTRLQGKKKRQEVTGLIVNSKVNVSRSYVRELRGMLHAWQKYGLEAAQKRFEEKYYISGSRGPFIRPPKLSQVIGGKISYLGHIRGREDPLYIRYRNWFRVLVSTI